MVTKNKEEILMVNRRIVNLTPHEIVVLNMVGESVVFPASGIVARVGVVTSPDGVFDSDEPLGVFQVSRQTFGEVEGLPPYNGLSPNRYIVSAMVLSALGGSRPDVVAPDTGSTAIRENGRIVAVRGFVR
jgi:hypothetical protein